MFRSIVYSISPFLRNASASKQVEHRIRTLHCSSALRDVLEPERNTPRPDKLYRRLDIELRAHDQGVLKSYETFSTTAARELDITHSKTTDPWRDITRRTLLRSIFVNKNCREQYEHRTYFKIIQFKHLTGSTADTFLEYLQRNLPEGVAMRVKKYQLEAMPEHIVPPVANPNTGNAATDSLEVGGAN